MKKAIIIFIVILVIAIVTTAIILIKFHQSDSDVGSFTQVRVYSEGYAIDITSSNSGHPDSSKNSIFSSSFKVKDKTDKTENNYNVHYLKITSQDELNPDLDLTKKITINDKEFIYDIDELTMWSANLYYLIPDSNDVLTIEVDGGNVYDNMGHQAKTLAMTDLSLLNSKELAGIVKFTISK